MSNEETPIGTVLFATAVSYIEGLGLYHNRDMLPGPLVGSGEAPYIWGVRITNEGSNGYTHKPEWLQFKKSNGEACFSVVGEGQNNIVTFVRVESVAEAIQKGPDAYGPSR